MTTAHKKSSPNTIVRRVGEVVSFNGDDSKTVVLFRKLDEKHKDLAKQCWNMAKDVIIKAKAYDLARKYIGNPVREFAKVKARYDHKCIYYDDPEIGGDRFKASNENIFVEESLKLIEVALAFDDRKAAKEIQTKALAILDDYRLRDAIPKVLIAARRPSTPTRLDIGIMRYGFVPLFLTVIFFGSFIWQALGVL